MVWLAIVSAVWPLSFGLIGQVLRDVNPHAAACFRLILSFLLFLPLLRPRGLTRTDILALAAIGTIQYGFMYLAYL